MKSKIRRLNKSIKRSKKRKYKRKKKGGEITNLAEDVKRIINETLVHINSDTTKEIKQYKRYINKYKTCKHQMEQGKSGAGIVELFDNDDTDCLNPYNKMLKYNEGITLKKPELKFVTNYKPVSIFSISDKPYIYYFTNSPKYDNYYRHSPDLCYGPNTIYLDMLCCLIDLRTTYKKIRNGKQTGGNTVADTYILLKKHKKHSFSYYIFPEYIKKIEKYNEYKKENKICNVNNEIKSSLLLNEYIIQQILYKYISNFHGYLYTNFVIYFEKLAIGKNEKDLYIKQEKIGSVINTENENEPSYRITHLLEYINFFVNKEGKNKDIIFEHILTDMLGINLQNSFLDLFFYKMDNDITTIITDYLQDFKDDSFFKCMRILYNDLGFLHLDFKLKNIFIRYNGFVSEDKNDKKKQKREQTERNDYKKYSCIIADLDKSRLQIDFNKLEKIDKDNHDFASV
jgi:hypothetical protein